MREIYSKYWLTAREEIYGFSEYDYNICQCLLERIPPKKQLLEVAVGTGYPIADALQKAGHLLFGTDISSDLVEKCRRTNPYIKCTISDAEELPYFDSVFDCTYCFHSTWYFPNVPRAVDEMLRVTRSPGLVVFDVQNAHSTRVKAGYDIRLAGNRLPDKMIRYVKNVAKIILRRGKPIWQWIVYEVPIYPENLYEHFARVGISDFCVAVKTDDDKLMVSRDKSSFKDYDRLVFIVNK